MQGAERGGAGQPGRGHLGAGRLGPCETRTLLLTGGTSAQEARSGESLPALRAGATPASGARWPWRLLRAARGGCSARRGPGQSPVRAFPRGCVLHPQHSGCFPATSGLCPPLALAGRGGVSVPSCFPSGPHPDSVPSGERCASGFWQANTTARLMKAEGEAACPGDGGRDREPWGQAHACALTAGPTRLLVSNSTVSVLD